MNKITMKLIQRITLIGHYGFFSKINSQNKNIINSLLFFADAADLNF